MPVRWPPTFGSRRLVSQMVVGKPRVAVLVSEDGILVTIYRLHPECALRDLLGTPAARWLGYLSGEQRDKLKQALKALTESLPCENQVRAEAPSPHFPPHAHALCMTPIAPCVQTKTIMIAPCCPVPFQPQRVVVIIVLVGSNVACAGRKCRCATVQQAARSGKVHVALPPTGTHSRTLPHSHRYTRKHTHTH